MKTKKAVSLLLLCIMPLASFSVDVTYSLTIHANDTSLRGERTFVEIPGRDQDISIPDGETIILAGYSSCVVMSRAEIGWYRLPTKAARSIKASPRDQLPAIITGNIATEIKSGRKRSTGTAKKIAMVDLMYPYEKQKVYLNGSLITVAAQLMAMGHQVEIVDLNIDDLNDETIRNKLRHADIVGISVIGSPYIPSAIEFAQNMSTITAAPVLMGGQVIEKLSQSQFATLFSNTNAIRAATAEDLAMALGCNVEVIPNAYQVSMVPVFEQLGGKLDIYLRHEMTLVLAQGCLFNCSFCAARKNQGEVHRALESFAADLRFLAQAAKNAGLEKIEFYASSLDFFQNPATVAEHLRILAAIQKEENIRIRVRCLSCMGSFLRASEAIPNFGELLNQAGLWCIGFGVDGTDKEVWQTQNKRHNKIHDMPRCLSLCAAIGVRPEILMVGGFPKDTVRTMSKNVWYAFRYVTRWPNAVLRPYLAKPFVPGNEGWNASDERVQAVIERPSLFYNLDFCALGSRLTHPGWWHRALSNLSYLTIIIPLAPFGRCATSPLLPQGSGGIKGWIAKKINRLMPFDR